MLPLKPSEEYRDRALEILESERARLRSLDLPGDLELVGGASVAGALTKGDIDLHLRVDPAEFEGVVTRLRSVHTVVHPEIWCETLAAFEVTVTALPTGLAVTPVGGTHDVRFSRTWELLRSRPDLVAEYNAAKLAPGNYEANKSAFFDRIVAAG
jgi:hypothetical protein